MSEHNRDGDMLRSVCSICGDAYVECTRCGIADCRCGNECPSPLPKPATPGPSAEQMAQWKALAAAAAADEDGEGLMADALHAAIAEVERLTTALAAAERHLEVERRRGDEDVTARWALRRRAMKAEARERRLRERIEALCAAREAEREEAARVHGMYLPLTVPVAELRDLLAEGGA